LTSSHTLIVNGKRIDAERGMTVADAALRGGVVIPTDCASGQCGTCSVRVVAGNVDGVESEVGRYVLACQARISGPVEVQFEQMAAPVRRRGRVAAVAFLTPDIAEVCVELDDPLVWRPGQYVKLAFQGYPSRDYSPTSPVRAPVRPTRLLFHIRVFQQGAVSSALRGAIGVGHRVIVDGPYGSAFYRPGPTRLVLVGTSTGRAPLWAIARVARLEEPKRPVSVVVGARRLHNLYMRDSFAWLRENGVSDLVLSSTETPADDVADVHIGRTTDFLGSITAEDTVHAAGAPEMVEAVMRLAADAGAQCFADPFTVSTTGRSFLERLRQAVDTSDPSRLQPTQARAFDSATGAERADRMAPERPRGLTGGLARWLRGR
jgi:3-phenylpropionate/trans-cinnamate dioxygenase ferredoxin reductase subunit